MNPIEKLKELEKQPVPAAWRFNRIFRELAPEILDHWEAGVAMGRAFNALYEAGGEDEALEDAMHQAFTHFANTHNELNAKAKEVLK